MKTNLKRNTYYSRGIKVYQIQKDAYSPLHEVYIKTCHTPENASLCASKLNKKNEVAA